MEACFTKGPWVVRESSDPYERVTTRNRIKNRNVDIATVCTQYTGLIGFEQQANLALILAAPELYAALTEARSTVASMTIHDMTKGDVPMHPKMLEMIDAAIAKATGQR